MNCSLLITRVNPSITTIIIANVNNMHPIYSQSLAIIIGNQISDFFFFIFSSTMIDYNENTNDVVEFSEIDLNGRDTFRPFWNF